MTEFDANDLGNKSFALLGLLDTSVRRSKTSKEIAPDYSKSFIRVYRDLTMWCIQTYKNLKVLSLIVPKYYRQSSQGAAQQLSKGFPFWLLWPMARDDYLITAGTLQEWIMNELNFSLASKEKTNIGLLSSRERGDVLSVLGVILGSVKSVIPYYIYRSHDLRHIQPRLRLRNLDESTDDQKGIQFLWHVLCADHYASIGLDFDSTGNIQVR